MKALISTILFFASFNLFAQANLTDEQKEALMANQESYLKELNLTEEQKPQVDQINKEYISGLKELKNSGGSRMQKYRKIKSLSSERSRQMKAVLTPEQFDIFEKHQEELKKEFKARRRATR